MRRVKFEFEVSDSDADTIMGCINDRRAKTLEDILEVMSDTSLNESQKKARIEWYRSHHQYLGEVVKKIKYTVVTQ